MRRRRVKRGPPDSKDFISQNYWYPQSNRDAERSVRCTLTLDWSLKRQNRGTPSSFSPFLLPACTVLTPLSYNKATRGFLCTSWSISYSTERTTIISVFLLLDGLKKSSFEEKSKDLMGQLFLLQDLA